MSHLHIHVLSSGRCAQLLRFQCVRGLRHELFEVIGILLGPLVHPSSLLEGFAAKLLAFWRHDIIHVEHLEVNARTLRVGVNHVHDFAHSRRFGDG